MNLLRQTFLAAVTAGALFSSCTTELFETVKQPTVAISDVESSSTSTISATIFPDANTVKFCYAIGQAHDRDAFLDGSLDAIEESTKKIEVLFEGLEQNTEYTLFAQGYNAEGEAGALASVVARTYNATCSVKLQYAGVNSAGLLIETNASVYKVDYAFGKPGCSEDFKNGDMDGIYSLTESNYKSLNYSDLEAETDYAFYTRFYDRAGGISPVTETPVSTSNKDNVPYVELEIGDVDIYTGNYTFVPNDKCSKYHFMVGLSGEYSTIFDNPTGYAGDIYSMMLNWVGQGWGVYTVEGVHNFELMTPELQSSADMEFYVMACDKDGNPANIQEFEFTTPKGEATGISDIESITLDEVTSYSAKFTITPNEHTFATFYEVFIKTNYDTYWTDYTSDLRDQFLSDYNQQIMYDHDVVWTKGNEPFEFNVEYGLDENTTYYVVAIPMSGEGLDVGGWGDVELFEFKTESL